MPGPLYLFGVVAITVLPAFVVLLYEGADRYTTLRIGLGLALGALLGLLTAWLSRRWFLVEPIHRLIAVLNDLRQGKYVPGAAAMTRSGALEPLVRAIAGVADHLAAREAALRESEQRFRRLSDASFEGVVIHDGERVIEANAAAARIFGYEPREVIGMPLIAFLAPEARDQALARARAEVETPYESIGLCKSGSKIPVEFRGRRIEQEGQPRRMIAIRDLTEQRNAAEALRASEARFRSLANLVPAFVWFATPDGDLHFLNDRWYEYSGQTPEQALPSGWIDALHPEDRDRTLTSWQETCARGISYEIEFRLRRRDGMYRWFVSRAEPLRDEAGRITTWFGTGIDIHDRKIAEEARRESEERLRAALSASRTGTYRWDMRTGVAQGDDAHTALFGVPIRSDKDFLERIHPEDRPMVAEMLRRCLNEGVDFELDYRVLLPDGRMRWLSDRGCVFKDENGKALHMTGAVIDITERKEAEARQRLLAAEVDHRAKNMLALVQIMLRQTRAASVEEFSRTVQGRVAALARAHTLLSQSRWEGADLRRLIEEELAPFRRIESRRVRLDGPPVALSPRAAQSFALALHELATNAAKYGALAVPQGCVSVEWACEGGQFVLRWIEARGPFVQAPSSRGLGMSVIERSIREQLEGAVRFDWRNEGLVCELAVPANKISA